jgi:hypothetical protein
MKIASNYLKGASGLVLVSILTGCGGFGGSSGGGASLVSGVGIFGVVSTSNASSLMSDRPQGMFEIQGADDVTAQAISGCTVTAKELGGADTVLATATTNASGQYDLTNLDSTKSYRISTDCPSGEKFSSVGKPAADSTSTTRIVTNPRSTLIAAMIVQSVLTAVESATDAIADATVKAAVKAALKKSFDALVTSITATIQEQIETGAMADPTPANATAITSSTVAATDGKTSTDMTTSINTGYTAGTIPPAVTDTLASAAKSTAALPDCDSTISGTSIQKCTVAVAKVMANMLGFTAALKEGTLATALGVSFVSGDCTSAKAELVAAFPKSKFKSNATDSNLPEGICVMEPATPRFNRNDSYNPQGNDGGGGGATFIENITLSGQAQAGLVSALATGLYNGYGHTLADVDKMIYGRTGTGTNSGGTAAGLDARLVAEVYSAGAKSYFYINSSGSWVNTSWPTCTGNNGVSVLCNPSARGDGNASLRINLSDMAWSATAPVSGDNTALMAPIYGATAYRSGILAFSPTFKAFGGTIPTFSQLKTFLDEDRVHSPYNPFGPAEMYVMYNMAPYRGANSVSGANQGCWDNDVSTTCYGADFNGTTGTAYPAVRVTFATTATAISGGAENGFKPFTNLNASGTTNTSTNYFVVPVYKYSFGPGVWSGAFKFIKTADGKTYKDEVGRERALFVVTDVSQCGSMVDGAGVTLPTAGSGTTGAGSCALGNAFNARLNFDDCQSGGGCPKIHITSATPVYDSAVGAGASKLAIDIRTQVKAQWLNYGNPSNGGHQVLSLQTFGGSQPMRITVDSSKVFDAAVPATFGYGTLATNEFYVAIKYDCGGTGVDYYCGPDVTGYYLVNGSGVVLEAAGATNRWANPTTLCSVGSSGPTCAASANYVKIPAAAFTGAGSFDFDPSTSGIQGFNTAFRFFDLDQGPVPNPVWRCSSEPFFVRASESSTDYTIAPACNSTDTAVNSGFKTFSNKWDYYRWVSDPAGASETPSRSSRALIENSKNAFAYGDPESAKALISTAFSGMLDGKNSLTATSRLTSLQAFALVYMTLSKDGDRQYFDGVSAVTSGATGAFYTAMPMDYMSGGGVGPMNTVFANGILNFRQ